MFFLGGGIRGKCSPFCLLKLCPQRIWIQISRSKHKSTTSDSSFRANTNGSGRVSHITLCCLKISYNQNQKAAMFPLIWGCWSTIGLGCLGGLLKSKSNWNFRAVLSFSVAIEPTRAIEGWMCAIIEMIHFSSKTPNTGGLWPIRRSSRPPCPVSQSAHGSRVCFRA